MTDRELLKLAARAAGIELGKDSPWRTFSDASGFDWLNMDGSRVEKNWNPLNDDGDAFRLAVKLRMEIGFEGDNVVFADGNFSEFLSEDPAAATRRAIVHAAAFLGGLK